MREVVLATVTVAGLMANALADAAAGNSILAQRSRLYRPGAIG
jgi:hypothetical protein